MGHRQFFPPSQSSDMGCEDIWNHPYPGPHLRLGIAVVLVPYISYTYPCSM